MESGANSGGRVGMDHQISPWSLWLWDIASSSAWSWSRDVPFKWMWSDRLSITKAIAWCTACVAGVRDTTSAYPVVRIVSAVRQVLVSVARAVPSAVCGSS